MQENVNFNEPIESYSWKVESPDVLVKTVDKSVFMHRGTGVPQEIKKYFGIEHLEKSARKSFTLICDGVEHNGRFEVDAQDTPRTRMFWDSKLAEVIQNKYPDEYIKYSNGENVDSEIKMKFIKQREDVYAVEFDNLFSSARALNFWWVNQGKSYQIGRDGGYIWAPNKDRGGRLPRHWATMKDVKKGDVIFNYANGAIRAISIAKDKSFNYVNQSAIDNWETDGQRIDLEYFDIDPIKIESLKNQSNDINSAIEIDNRPLNRIGGVNQGYLFNFSLEAARIIRNIYGKEFPSQIENLLRGFIMENNEIYKCDKSNMLLQTKKQIILYGPPGTGKTFNTKAIALNVLLGGANG